MSATNVMEKEQAVRDLVRSGYAKIAQETSAGCCSPGVSCCGSAPQDADKLARELGYTKEELQALPEGANMGLSCGNPGALAALKLGETVLDLGSGGGFPAVPLALASKGHRQFILVEPNNKKCSFLRAVSRELGLDLRVEARRVEQISPHDLPSVDVITSRALAALKSLCALALPFVGPQTRAIFHKGREHVDELAESSAVHYHDVVVVPSVVNEKGVLLELTNLRLQQK
jgi:16S rRNA (guanine(527)-N(7))-methyltransferase RsmG